MIKVGDKLPDVHPAGILEVEGNGCSIGPNPVEGRARPPRARPSRCSALPGAFTPTCSAKHVPGYVAEVRRR